MDEIEKIKHGGRYYQAPKPVRPDLIKELQKHGFPLPSVHNDQVEQAWNSVLDNVRLRRRFEELQRRKQARIDARKAQILE